MAFHRSTAEFGTPARRVQIKWIERLCIFALVAASLSYQVTAQNAAAGFNAVGDWQFSGLPGAEPNKSSIWSMDPNASAIWTPQIGSVGPVRISFYVVAGKSNAPTAKIIVWDGKLETREISLQAVGSHWEEVGTFNFQGERQEYVKVVRDSPGDLRVAGLKFEVLDPQNEQTVWQVFVDDDVLPVDQNKLRASVQQFYDMQGNPDAEDAGLLSAEGVLPPAGSGAFDPMQPITPSEIASAFDVWNKSMNLSLSSGELLRLDGRPNVTGKQMISILVEAARDSGKNLDWLKAQSGDYATIARALGFLSGDASGLPTQDSPVTREQAAVVLRHFEEAIVEAGPPASSHWKLTFDDEFNGNSLNYSVWSSENGTVRGLSSRWPENAQVSGGLLHLVTRKESKGGKQWTTAGIWTTNFRQAYGYWEARYRYARTTGLNNAFWINTRDYAHQQYEIDINEGHYPNEVNSTLHQTGLPDNSTRYLAPFNLADDFHVYACLWTKDVVIYYVDGKEIARKPNVKAQIPAPILFSTALISWAGAVSDAANGTSMDVDWVRVYSQIP